MPEENATGWNPPTSPPHMVGASFGMEHAQISTLSNTISELSGELRGLKDSLGKFNTFTANPFNSALSQIENQANQALAAVNNLTGAVEGVGGQGGVNLGAGGGRAGGATGFGQYFSQYESPLISVGMSGLSWLRDRVATNRDVSLKSAGAFGMMARQQGVDVSDIMGQAARFPGGVYGTPQELMQLLGAAPSLGASFGFGGARGQGVRAAGMFAGVREAQMLNPGEQVGSIVQNIGGFAANTRAQQMSQMITGGAMGMIGAGGRQKTLSQWAEDTLRWLEGLRGGGNRGKPFNYGELMAQYFPGSNIDAWFDANGVPENMKQYWWTYALQKANKTGGTGGGAMEITPDTHNLAQARLRSTSEMTRTEFGVGAKMTPSYVNRESMNQWFNSMMGSVQEMLFSLLGSKLNLLQYLPDTVEDLLFSGVEMGARSLDSALQSFGGIGNLVQTIALAAAPAVADVEGWPAGIGDLGGGGYGMEGGTGLAGLSLNMRSKLGPMMKANPRLKINSGLRDNAMQRRLKDKGYSRVSGGPSAHTRGDAADLGPASEYGWIVANAKKFGLRSGAKKGEPWHVGVGDIPGLGAITDVAGGILGSVGGGLMGSIPGLGPLLSLAGGLMNMGNFQAGGLGMFGSLFPAMGGLMTGGGIGGLLGMLGGGADAAVSAAKMSENLLSTLLGPMAGMIKAGGGMFAGYDDTLLQRLSTQQITLGGLPSNILGGGGGPLGGLLGSLPGLGGLGGMLGGGGLPIPGLGLGMGLIGGAVDAARQSFSGTPSERAITVARLASQYWHGEDLLKAVAISGRESSWDPKAHRTDHRPKDPKYGDRGLFQINYSLDPSMMQKGLYDNPSDLFDPATNIRTAYELWKNAGGSWKPWSMTAHGWDKNGDPLYGAKVEEARAAIHSAGVGDYERMDYQSYGTPVSQRGGFHLDLSNSTFQVPQQLLGGQNGQQMDIRRTVTLLADYLEDEMNRRMARAN